AGRARRDAREASEAPVEVLRDGVGPLELALCQPAHQVDAPARRVHLLRPGVPGRTGRQTEAAVDAVVVERAPAGVRIRRRRGHQIPPTKRPGARRRSGSRRSFTPRIRAIAAGGAPQTSAAARTGAGAARTTRDPPPSASRARADSRAGPSGAAPPRSPPMNPSPSGGYPSHAEGPRAPPRGAPSPGSTAPGPDGLERRGKGGHLRAKGARAPRRVGAGPEPLRGRDVQDLARASQLPAHERGEPIALLGDSAAEALEASRDVEPIRRGPRR